MTPLSCPHYMLRFTPAAGAYLVTCPECREPLQPSSLEGTVGFRIFRLTVRDAAGRRLGVWPLEVE